jgi:hypothetical protein
MAVEDVLAGISGGLSGGMSGYMGMKKYQQDERAISSREEQARLRAEVMQMIAQLNAGSREKVAGINSDAKVEVANVNQAGANSRHATASGSVIENNRGAMERLKKNIDFGYDKTFAEEAGRNARWVTPSGNALTGAETTRRGQDVGAATARRGQDIGASTATRGQDLTFQLGNTRDATTRQDQANNLTLGTERNKILKKKGSIYDNLFTEPGGGSEPPEDINLPVETPAPTAAPARGQIPVTPRTGGGVGAPLPVPQNVEEADVDTLAKSILTTQGVPATPENLKTFKDRNRDRLIQQIRRAREGGAR